MEYKTDATPPLSSPPRVVVPSLFQTFSSLIIFKFLFGSITSMWLEKVTPPPSPLNFAKIVGALPPYLSFDLSK